MTETIHGVAKGEQWILEACRVELGTNLCFKMTCIVKPYREMKLLSAAEEESCD
jgi:hypothetical protein